MVVEDLHDLVRLLEEHPEWRAELRRVLLGNELLQMPELVREIFDILRRHSEILERHSQATERLTEAQRRTEQRIEELARLQQQAYAEFAQVREEANQRFAELAEAQRQVGEQLSRLVEWQRGEAGRRDGERYERNTARRAVTLGGRAMR